LLTKINNNGTTVVMVTHEHDLVRTFQRRVIVIQKGKVVSDTPDPTFAKFKTKETKKENDMFYYEQDVKNENLTEVFEDLEENSTEPQSDENKKENIGSVADESSEGTVDLNELAQGGEQ
jgi:cell division ATP-binding protein ftsE